MKQFEINELLKIANSASREELLMLMSEASKDYMAAPYDKKNLEYSKVKIVAVLIQMKEVIRQVGIEGFNKKLKEQAFTDNLFNVSMN